MILASLPLLVMALMAPPLVPPPVVVTIPPPPSPATPAALPAARQASHENGLAFARVYAPTDRVTASGLQGARDSFRRSFDADPQGAAMEKRYPGARSVALAATEAAVAQMYAQQLPGIQDRIATFITQYFSDADLAKVTAFMSSPTGRVIQNAVGENASMERLRSSANKDTGEFKLESKDIMNAVDPGFIARLTPAQIAEFAAFNTSPPGRRFNQVAPALLTLVAAETTAMVNQGMAGVQTKVMQAVADHIRSKPKP